MQEEQHERSRNERRVARQEEQCKKNGNMKRVVVRKDQQYEEQSKEEWKCEEQ
jgi:hypothetical protein